MKKGKKIYKKKIIFILIAIVLVMVVAYSSFTSKLNINGMSSISSKWDIEITGIRSQDMKTISSNGSEKGDTYDISEPTFASMTASFKTGLKTPGTSRLYEIEVSNLGTFNGKVGIVNLSCGNNSAISCHVNESKDQLYDSNWKSVKSSSILFDSGDTALDNKDFSNSYFSLKTGEKHYLYIQVIYNDVTSQPDNVSADISLELNYVQDINKTTHIGGNEVTYYDKNSSDVDGLHEDANAFGRYYYSGKDADNNISFNDDIWKIISVENDGSLKITNNKCAFRRQYDKTTNDWNKASLNDYLNDDYYNNTLYKVSSSYIEDHLWNIGGVSASGDLDSTEKAEGTSTWTGKIGLMSVSDVLKSSSNMDSCGSINNWKRNYNACFNSSWFTRNTNFMLINKYGTSTNMIWSVANRNLVNRGVNLNQCVNPTLYLKPGLNLSGSGKENDPYKIKEDKKIYTVTYDANGGSSVSRQKDIVFDGDNANLSVTATYKDFQFIGWNTNKDAKEKLDNLIINKDTTLYAIWKDNAAPNIIIDPNGNSDYTSKTQIKITASDNVGLAGDQKLKYAFSLSNTDEPSEWESINLPLDSDNVSSTVTIDSSDLTGTYYLWIKNDLSDVNGNKADSNVVSKAFKFDNTPPTLNVSNTHTDKKITLVVDSKALSEINKYEFKLHDSDDWIDNGTNNIYTFNDLMLDSSYKIDVRVTSNSSLSSINTIEIKTNASPNAPTFTTRSEVVTIMYPEGCGSIYTCNYQKDNEEVVNVTDLNINVPFDSDGTLTASVSNGSTTTSSTFNYVSPCKETLINGIKMKACRDDLSSKNVSDEDGIDFTRTSSNSNGNGLYVRANTANDTHPIYYYRGDVTNNNVYFGGYCWKIVRTTNTGGTKMIYSGKGQSSTYIESNPVEKSSYANIKNDATYPYSFDETSKKWTSTNKNSNSTSSIEFTAAANGDYVLYFQISSEKNDKVTIYKDGEVLETVGGELNDSIKLTGLTSDNVIKVSYAKNDSTSSEKDSVSFNLGIATGKKEEEITSCGNDNSPLNYDYFNYSAHSLGYAGYTYNTLYKSENKKTIKDFNVYGSKYPSTEKYYYSDSVTYDKVNNIYTLKNSDGSEVKQDSDSWSNVYNDRIGKYSCLSASIDGNKCQKVYFVAGGNSSIMYYFSLENGQTNDNTKIYIAESYSVDSGTYTLTDPIEVNIGDWYNDYASYDSKTVSYYICNNFAKECSSTDFYKITDTSRDKYSGQLVSKFKYGNNFIYDETEHKYKLVDTDISNIIKMSDVDFSDNYNKLTKNHYTCFNDSGECTTLSYIYYVNNSGDEIIYYISLENGNDINDALEAMLSKSSANTYNSQIKRDVENWYGTNMTNYTNYLEDTPYCFDRTITSKGGWDPNGGSFNDSLVFKNGSSKDNTNLYCKNVVDNYTVDSKIGNGKLAYPIGLITNSEAILAGLSYSSMSSNYLNFGISYYTGIPSVFDPSRMNYSIINSSISDIVYYYVSSIRPVISLKNDVKFTLGDGTNSNPYRLP